MKTVAIFQSHFWKIETDSPDVSIGKMPIEWLVSELRRNHSVVGPIKEDWGWLATVDGQTSKLLISLGARPQDSSEPAVWIIFVEKKTGFLRKIIGKSDSDEKPIVYAIDKALKAASHIHTLEWHSKENFDKGDETAGSMDPN